MKGSLNDEVLMLEDVASSHHVGIDSDEPLLERTTRLLAWPRRCIALWKAEFGRNRACRETLIEIVNCRDHVRSVPFNHNRHVLSQAVTHLHEASAVVRQERRSDRGKWPRRFPP